MVVCSAAKEPDSLPQELVAKTQRLKEVMYNCQEDRSITTVEGECK